MALGAHYHPTDSVANSVKTCPSKNASVDRVHYLDNLRAIAMLLGVFLHAGMAYALPSQEFWLATDTGSSVAVDVSIVFIHLFRMGLFFLLSGYFAKLVIQRKGVRHFLANRFARLVLPFLLFYPVLLFAMWLVIVFGLKYVAEPRGLMGVIAESLHSLENGSENSATSLKNSKSEITTMHLWFIYYLLMFSCIGAIVHVGLMRCSWLRFDNIFSKPWWVLLSPLALIPGIYGSGVPLPPPESFLPTWWPFAFYGLFFYAGWNLFGNEEILDFYDRFLWHILGVSLLLFAVYYRVLPEIKLSQIVAGHPLPNPHWSAVALTAILSVSLTLLSLLLGRRFMAAPIGRLSFIADSSYWIYLTHLPIVVFLQCLLIPWSVSVYLKLSITIIVTLFFCFAAYVSFVRYTPIGHMLHGKRKFP